MDKETDKIISRLTNLEDVIISTKTTLSSLIDLQLSLETSLQQLLSHNKSETIAIKSASKIDFIPVKEIMYCSADLAYTEIVTLNHGKIYATKSINEYEEYLFDHPFFRISKSFLVNTKYIHSYDRRTGQILMRNRDLLDVARRRRTEFLSNILAI